MSGTSSAFSPTPMASQAGTTTQRPMSAMSQPTNSSTATMLMTQPAQGSGSVSTSSGTYQLPPGAMPLPGMTTAGSNNSSSMLPQQYQQQQYPLTHSSPRAQQQQQDPYYWNQY